MHKPGLRIRTQPIDAWTEPDRPNVENMFSGIDVPNAARQSAGLQEAGEHVPIHLHGSMQWPTSGHPVMRILEVILFGLSIATAPILLLLSVAGLSWAGWRWAGLG